MEDFNIKDCISVEYVDKIIFMVILDKIWLNNEAMYTVYTTDGETITNFTIKDSINIEYIKDNKIKKQLLNNLK